MPVLKNFGIFHPSRLPQKSDTRWDSYGDDSIEGLCEAFGVPKTDEEAQGTVGNSNYSTAFPMICILLRYFAIIPMSNAIVERLFSLMNHIKTKRRNRIRTTLLDMLMRVNLLAPVLQYIGIKRKKFREPDYKNVDLEAIYRIWKQKAASRSGFVSMLKQLDDNQASPETEAVEESESPESSSDDEERWW